MTAVTGATRVPVTDLTTTPAVSVVIPCYNYGRFLPDALSSVLSQAGVDLDVTVVDDASNDDSVRIAEEFAAQDPRMRVLQHRTNLGHINTFNECLRAGTADLLVKLDADDLLTPGQLMRSAALMQARPSLGFVYGRVVAFSHPHVPATPERPVRSWRLWNGRDWIERRARSGRNPILQPEVMLRRSVLREVGGHREEVPAASDLNLWLRMAAVADVGRVDGPAHGLYRLHSESMQRTSHAGVLNDLRARLMAFELFFDEWRDGDAAASRRSMRSTLAMEALGHAVDALDGGGAVTDAARLVHFAVELCPDVQRSGAWTTYRRRAAGGRRSRFLAPARRLRRDLRSRVLWRRWQWSGE